MQSNVIAQPSPGRPSHPEWALTVVRSHPASGGMQRVTLTCEKFSTFRYRPGQALTLVIPVDDGSSGRRIYTIRAFDQARNLMTIDFFLHGPSPATNWATSVKPGDRVTAFGPRGKTTFNPEAAWHLFTGDETCLPAIAHILETIPESASTHVFLEVQNSGGEVALAHPVTWIHRGDQKAGPGTLMVDAVARFGLPSGQGHAYLIGETSNVRAQRRLLIERGLSPQQISAEGYWRPDRIGGHDHVDD